MGVHPQGLVGVAISTTGHTHRLDFLATAVNAWRHALPTDGVLVVTVDGDEADALRVHLALGPHVTVVRVGQPRQGWRGTKGEHGRLGVAANKNTGIEHLMDAGVQHLFLADDDIWPKYSYSLTKHTDLSRLLPHSLVCWGGNRLMKPERGQRYAEWNWPRGVMLYATRAVIEQVGGMDERFGLGGHEHAEWSRRIHQHGLTPAEYVSPASYAERGANGTIGYRADALWHCEDMRQRGQSLPQLGAHRQRITTIQRSKDDQLRIGQVMASRDGDTSFVPFSANENKRRSATLCTSLPRQGAEGENQA